MTAYRSREKLEPSESDRETDALRDLLARMKRLRTRVALPSRYYLGAATFLIAAVLCSAPVLAPGVMVYLVARAQLRRAWREEHRKKGVSKEWLAENIRRFS